MELYNRIKARREELGLSQEELATKLGYKSRSTINKIEMGKNDLNQSKISAFAKALNTTPAYLMGWEESPQPEPKNVFPIEGKFVNIPVVGRVAAGISCFTENNIVDYEPIEARDIQDGEDYAFLRVIGDSMYPEFKEGDLVLVRCQTSVDSGSYAVVIIDGEDGVIKKIIYGKDWIELHSINPMYPVRRFENEDVLRIRVFGLVKQVKRKF